MPGCRDWVTVNFHMMFVKNTSSGRKLMKLGDFKGENSKELPAISEEAAAKDIINFLDHQCLRPFLDKFGLSVERMFITMLKTHKFFLWTKMLEGAMDNIKTKLELMVEEYGDAQAKSRYRKQKHSALTDAWVLERMLHSDNLKGLLEEWLDSRVVGL